MGAALGTPTVTHLPPAEILEAEKADKVERSGESLPAASETHSLNGFAQGPHVPHTETHTSLSLPGPWMQVQEKVWEVQLCLAQPLTGWAGTHRGVTAIQDAGGLGCLFFKKKKKCLFGCTGGLVAAWGI